MKMEWSTRTKGQILFHSVCHAVHQQKPAQPKPAPRPALQEQHPWGSEETGDTAQQHFCTGYLVGMALPCVHRAASTPLKGLLGPKGRTPASCRPFTQHPAPGTAKRSWQRPRAHWEVGEHRSSSAGCWEHQTHSCRTAVYGESQELTGCHNRGAHAAPFLVSHLKCTFGKMARHYKYWALFGKSNLNWNNLLLFL